MPGDWPDIWVKQRSSIDNNTNILHGVYALRHTVQVHNPALCYDSPCTRRLRPSNKKLYFSVSDVI